MDPNRMHEAADANEVEMNDLIRDILREHARLAVNAATLRQDESLYEAGMSSHAGVNVMLALEGAFEVEFPDRMLRRSVFESIHSISEALAELSAERLRAAG